jgi:L(+)-tartrate dehydratase alpha subunit
MCSINTYKKLVKLLTNFISIVSIRLPDDVLNALKELAKNEENPYGKFIYDAMFKNINLAISKNIPLCQDTGIPQFYVKLGENFPFKSLLLKALNEATSIATKRSFLRPNVVDPFNNENTGNNIGLHMPWIELELIPDVDYTEITLYLAGGGSSKPGVAKVFDPTIKWKSIIKFILHNIVKYGSSICPPLLIGVGIGPTIEIAASLSKKAILRPIGSKNLNSKAAILETLLKNLVNKLGIGPQGLGGTTTIMDAHIEYAGRHPATLAVAISTSCWALRRGTLKIHQNLCYEVLNYTGVTI